MKFKIILLLPLLALLVCGGCVSSRTPVGDKAAVLDPKIWNAKWQSGDGSIVRTKIKDAKLGIVEVTTRPPWPKPGEKKQEILVRQLGPLAIANSKTEPPDVGYEFGRIAIDNADLLVFSADESVFASLVKRHEIAGKLVNQSHRHTFESCVLKGFSEKDYQRLKREGFDVRSLFDEDPGTVLVRYTWRPFW